jgi:hypothetical protein
MIETLCTGDSAFSRFELVELARQITLVEHDLYLAIKPQELLGQAWTKKNKERDSPNILRLIDHFNNVCLPILSLSLFFFLAQLIL